MQSGNIVKVGAAEAEVIAHSIVMHSQSPDIEVFTTRTRYWRAIHSEVMTHRVFSRNARSSRAVPTPRLVKEAPYVPKFGMLLPGMQAGEAPSPTLQKEWEKDWEYLAEACRTMAMKWHKDKMHKQWANRCLEWFGYIDTLISATDWANFQVLRDHGDAMPEINDLAIAVREAHSGSQPVLRSPYDDHHERGWHLPYVTAHDRHTYALPALQKLSSARSARISYTPFDMDKADVNSDYDLFDRLNNNPLHASPFEHVCCPDVQVETHLGHGVNVNHWAHQEEHGNFYGWRQFRKTLPNEAAQDSHYQS